MAATPLMRSVRPVVRLTWREVPFYGSFLVPLRHLCRWRRDTWKLLKTPLLADKKGRGKSFDRCIRRARASHRVVACIRGQAGCIRSRARGDTAARHRRREARLPPAVTHMTPPAAGAGRERAAGGMPGGEPS